MQLRGARLCLDCEELHDKDRCPVCASDAFAYLSRWVPATERRSGRRHPSRPVESASKASKLAKAGAAGIALVALGRWVWQVTQPGGAAGAGSKESASKGGGSIGDNPDDTGKGQATWKS